MFSTVPEEPKGGQMAELARENGGQLDFLNIHSDAKYQKIEGRIVWRHKKFSIPIKSHDAEKTEREPLSLAGLVCSLKRKKNYYSLVLCAKWYNLAP